MLDLWRARVFPNCDRAEIGSVQKPSSPEEHCFAVLNVFSQQPQRKSLCKKCKRELVFLVTERTGDLLKKRFVASMGVDLVPNPIGFLSQTELRSPAEHAAYVFFR